MKTSVAKVGLSADLFNSKGEPMFGPAPLALLSEAGLAWTIVPTQQGRLSPSAFTDYEAVMIGGSRVSDAELAGESGKLRVIARNGVGALVRTGLTPHNLPADCSNDRADECSTWTNSSKAAISIAK